MPKITVGMPVYNGERYVEESIKSVLAQTFDHFELLVSDNGSTDRTAEICQDNASILAAGTTVLIDDNGAESGSWDDSSHLTQSRPSERLTAFLKQVRI